MSNTGADELIGKCAQALDGNAGEAMRAASEKRANKTSIWITPKASAVRHGSNHLASTRCCRLLEEQKDAESAIEAARAQKEREPGRKH